MCIATGQSLSRAWGQGSRDGGAPSSVTASPARCTLTLSGGVAAYSLHTYQSEIFPTRIRSQAVAIVFSCDRLAGMASGFFVAAILQRSGAEGVFLFLFALLILASSVLATFGPLTRNWSIDVDTKADRLPQMVRARA
jgi:MFS family permease